jgi:hypothetical protein
MIEDLSCGIITDPLEIQQIREENKITSYIGYMHDPIHFLLQWNGYYYEFTTSETRIRQITGEDSQITQADALLFMALKSLPFNRAIYSRIHSNTSSHQGPELPNEPVLEPVR